MPNLPAAETNTESLISYHSTYQPVTWWQIDYIGLLSSWKRPCFVLIGIVTVDIDLLSLHTMILPKLSSIDLHGIPCIRLSIIMVFHTILFLIKEHFTGKEVCQRVHVHRIHWSYHVPFHSETAGSTELWNGLFKTVTVPARWQ